MIIGIDEGAIQNAGRGTEIWRGGPENGEERLVKHAVRVSEYAVNSMIRESWLDYEEEKGNYLFDKMDQYFERAIQYGQKLDLACFMTSANHGVTIDGGMCAYPPYVHEALQASAQKDVKYSTSRGAYTRWEPNFENPYFFERYDALLKAFAEYLEGDAVFEGRAVQRKKLVRYIEMRHFGFWGEGAYPPALVPKNAECLIRIADAYAKHFPDIRLIVPTNGMVYSPNNYDTIKDYHFHLLTAKNKVGLFGIFRDNWGWDENLSYVQKLFYEGNKYEKDGVKLYELIRDRWKSAPLVGEPLQAVPKEGFRPYMHLLEQVKYLHPAVIRNANVSNGRKWHGNPTGYNAYEDPRAMADFHTMYAIIGYRYLFTSATVTRKGGDLAVALDWLNIGLTPAYEEWKVQFLLKDKDGETIWTGASSLDLRTLFPDEAVEPGVVNEKKAATHVDRFKNVPQTGTLYLQIVDPAGVSPPMALSIKGRTEDGMYALTTASECEPAIPTKNLAEATPERFDVHVNDLPTQGVPVVKPWKVFPLDPDYCGGWVVAGDLTGDGIAEIVSARNGVPGNDIHYTASVVVHRLDGSVLWKWGNPDARNAIHHDVACQIYDLDADGRNEVVVAADREVIVLDGAKGTEVRSFAIPENASDSITFCNASGHKHPSDMLVKTRYTQLWAYNTDGKLLWTVEKPGGFRTSHQPYPVDLDDDGRDELIAGFAALNHDGSLRWRLPDAICTAGHADSIRLFQDGQGPANKRLLLTHCGGNRMDMLDGNGKVHWSVTGLHFESVFFGELDKKRPGREIVVDICHQDWGKAPLLVLDEQGRLLGRYMAMRSRQHRLVDWFGTGEALIFCGQTRALLDAKGHKRARFETPMPKGAWTPGADTRLSYMIHLADVTGDGRPDLVVNTVPGTAVWVYRNERGPKNLAPERLTMPTNATLY